MVSQGYTDWLNAGRPYNLIRPARALVTALQAYGLTVYHYPDAAHLAASRPEDHTPFSVTGWPGANKRWNARGVDVMPRSGSAAALRENADIARQLIRDRNAGVPGVAWIKYINWTDEQGVTRQERWMPNHTTVTSGDKGHVHISGRSDVDTDDRADGYDPIARMNGATGMALTLDYVHIGPDGQPVSLGTAIARLYNESFATRATLAAIAAKVDIDAAELAAIQASAQAGAAAALAANQEQLIAAIVAALGGVVALPGGGTPDDAAIEAAVRRVFADAGQA
jgi:hypothetical protein